MNLPYIESETPRIHILAKHPGETYILVEVAGKFYNLEAKSLKIDIDASEGVEDVTTDVSLYIHHVDIEGSASIIKDRERTERPLRVTSDRADDHPLHWTNFEVITDQDPAYFDKIVYTADGTPEGTHLGARRVYPPGERMPGVVYPDNYPAHE